jgi:hypothetical protein
MDLEEFGAAFSQLKNEISLIKSSRAAFYASWQTEDQLPVLNRHKGFFSPSREALRQTMLMTTARIIDKDTRTASIPNLIIAIQENQELLLHRTDETIAKLVSDLTAMSGSVTRLNQLRNQRLAHWDRGDIKLPRIEKQEIDQLIDQAIKIFNVISSAVDRSVTSWIQIERDTESRTKLLFEVAELGIVTRKENIERKMMDDLEAHNKKISDGGGLKPNA